MPRHTIATPLICCHRGAVLQPFHKMVAICVVCHCIATGVCYCNHLKIVLQLVGIIAMALQSCISIDFRCNYLVLLQLYWIWLLLLVTIAMVVLRCNNLLQCCNCQVVIATRILNGCNSMFVLPWFFWVVIILCGVAIVRYLLQLES